MHVYAFSKMFLNWKESRQACVLAVANYQKDIESSALSRSGVIGLHTARSLLQKGASVVILDKGERLCLGATGAGDCSLDNLIRAGQSTHVCNKAMYCKIFLPNRLYICTYIASLHRCGRYK